MEEGGCTHLGPPVEPPADQEETFCTVQYTERVYWHNTPSPFKDLQLITLDAFCASHTDSFEDVHVNVQVGSL